LAELVLMVAGCIFPCSSRFTCNLPIWISDVFDRCKPLGALSRRNAGSVVGRRTKKTGAIGMRKRKLHWASNAEHVAMRLLDSHHESAGVHLVSNFGQFHFRFVVLHLEHGMQMDACHVACALTLNLS